MNCTAATVPTVLEEEQPFTCAAHPQYQIALPVLQNLEATAVRIATVNGPLTIISCYHPPQILLRENDITEILEIPAPRSSPRVTSTASTRSGAVEGPTATVEFYSSSRTTQTC
jgi:hypothetical protein